MAIYPRFDGSEICSQIDPEIWFPTGANQTGALAKRLCLTCPWLMECRNYAVSVDVVGIWGATNEKERSKMRKTMKVKIDRLDLEGIVEAIKKGA